MRLHLSSRRNFLRIVGITSALVVLGGWCRKSLAQNPNLTVAQAEAWVAQHGMTAAEYQSELNKYAAQGYRPVVVSGYAVGNQDRYAALFEKNPNTFAWEARHGLSSAEYQMELNNYTAQGYRPVQVSGYTVNNQDRYAVIFEQTPNAPIWVASHSMTSAEYQSKLNEYTVQGYRPVDISGYSVNNQDRYAFIFEQTPNAPTWVASHGMTSAEYQSKFNEYTAQGYRLAKLSGYSLNGQDRYAAIWEKSGSGALVANHGMTSQEYQDELDRYFYQGYRLVWVNGYTVNGQDRYAAIWESQNGYNASEMQAIDEIVDKFMKDYGVPGLSFAIAKDGCLVLAKTYGYADTSTGEKVAPRHRFRIASLSKPITSIAIMKLVEEGQINLSAPVFGTGGILGTEYGTTPYKANIEKITVEHLLNHLSGGWPKGDNDPMFSNLSMNQAQLISWTLDNRPLDNVPGTESAYSNFGFCVLGRVIEKVTGQTYENYVKNNILSQCGVTDMEIGGDSEAEKKANEVTYYGQGGENPYGLKVARMDSHGGWIAKPIDLVRVLVRVDGFNTKSDILNNSTLVTMYTGSSVKPDYAKGWFVNSLNNHWHDGNLRGGTQAIMVNTSEGFSWAVLVNTRSQKSNFDVNLDNLMWEIKSKVMAWPSFDLF